LCCGVVLYCIAVLCCILVRCCIVLCCGVVLYCIAVLYCVAVLCCIVLRCSVVLYCGVVLYCVAVLWWMKLKYCGVAVIKNFAMCDVYVILRAMYVRWIGRILRIYEFRSNKKLFTWKNAVTVFCWIFVRYYGVDRRFFAVLRCSRPPSVPLLLVNMYLMMMVEHDLVV